MDASIFQTPELCDFEEKFGEIYLEQNERRPALTKFNHGKYLAFDLRILGRKDMNTSGPRFFAVLTWGGRSDLRRCRWFLRLFAKQL